MSDDSEEVFVLSEEIGTLSFAETLKLLITFQVQNLYEKY